MRSHGSLRGCHQGSEGCWEAMRAHSYRPFRSFDSRWVSLGELALGRHRARCLTVRFPMPPVRPVRETFASYGSRERDIMGRVHFASSTVHSPWTALRVRWVPLYCFPTLSLRPLPKPGCRHPDSATKPDMNVSVHPAPQQRGACHAYLGNQSPWLFSYRDNVDVTVVDCLSHRSLLAFWAGCDRLRFCHHP